MPTLKMGSTTVLTDTTLANAVQDNITRLGTVTTGILGSDIVLPTGTLVTSTMSVNGTTSNSLAVNSTTHANHLTLSFPRKYANSDFIITIFGRTSRASSSGNFYFGYTRGIGSLGTSSIAEYAVTDCDDNWIMQCAMFIDTTSGTAGDVTYWGSFLNNTVTGSFAFGKLLVQEFI